LNVSTKTETFKKHDQNASSQLRQDKWHICEDERVARENFDNICFFSFQAKLDSLNFLTFLGQHCILEGLTQNVCL